jgi:uncharacterized membrane protein
MNLTLLVKIFQPYYCLVDQVFTLLQGQQKEDALKFYFTVAMRIPVVLVVFTTILLLFMSVHTIPGGTIVLFLFWLEMMLLYGVASILLMYHKSEETEFDPQPFTVKQYNITESLFYITIFFVVFTSPAWYFFLFGFGTEF